jgi:hypothetical protein
MWWLSHDQNHDEAWSLRQSGPTTSSAAFSAGEPQKQQNIKYRARRETQLEHNRITAQTVAFVCFGFVDEIWTARL